MKILRVRRGFTTNSSGDNEYISPTPPPPAPSKTARDASTADARSADARSGDAGADAEVREAEVDAEHVQRADAEIASVEVRLTPDASPAPTGMGSHGSALTLIWVVVGVVVMFVAERILRLVWRRSRDRTDGRFDDDDSI